MATAEITCLCGKFQETVSLDTSSPVHVCHCNVCRSTTGALLYAALALQGQPQGVQGLVRYNSSDRVSRYFCGICGSHVFHSILRNDSWHVAAGVIQRVSENGRVYPCSQSRSTIHEYVADTVDGGLAVPLFGSLETPASFYLQDSSGTRIQELSRNSFVVLRGAPDDATQLQATCHCRGVQFLLSRPNEGSRACSSPWPDLLRPYHSHDPANPEDVKWWIRGSDKYLAGTCACQSCRLSISSPVTCWAFVPRANLSKVDGTPFDSGFGTLRGYQSSEGRTREFCKVCGASVLLCIDERPDLLDITLGLFQAKEGSRAETWFQWCTDRVSFAEESLDKDLVISLELGLKKLD